MQTQPLPRQLDVRKLAAAGAGIRAREPVSAFPRFVAGLLSDSGEVDVDLQFHVDEQGLNCIEGHVRAAVQATCQRCMQPMAVAVDSVFRVGLVWGESQLQSMPKELESVVMETDMLDVAPLVEDELILGMPIVAFHDETDCEGVASAAFPPPDDPDDEEQRENPFAVLEKLKSSDKSD